MADRARQATGDRRTRRTRQALEQGLLALLEEQRYETISIQQITDRASVWASDGLPALRRQEAVVPGHAPLADWRV